MRWGWLLLAIVLLLSVADAAGPRVRRSCLLGWDAVADEDLAGYRVYVSTSPGIVPDGASYVLQTNNSTTQATCRQLGLVAHNQQYYVVVTAIDEVPNESQASNEQALVVTMGGVLFR
jgi:hypothetical protein